jgi:YqaJ-like viral recombinase domain
MKHIMVEQGSAAWYRVRLGVPSASNFDKIITPGGKPSQQARRYKYRLIAERLLRESQDDEIGHVRWVAAGKENEPYAAAHFQEVNGVELKKCGFCMTDDGRLGASPDRFVGKSEGMEIKCPQPFTQIGYLLDGPGEEYKPQVQGQLIVTGFEAIHFFSWHGRMPSYHLVTLPDRNYQATLGGLRNQFCDELDRDTERAKALGAYAVSTEIITPGEAAYSEEEPYRIVIPEGGGELGRA